jgi:hypothetical protein
MKILIIMATVVLNGCAVYDAFMMAPYDPNEYKLITEVRVDAAFYRSHCDNPLLAPGNAQAISAKTNLFEKYQEMIPRNNNGYQAAKALNEIAQGLSVQYTKSTSVSTTFCRLKYNTIEKNAESIQRITARRPR